MNEQQQQSDINVNDLLQQLAQHQEEISAQNKTIKRLMGAIRIYVEVGKRQQRREEA